MLRIGITGVSPACSPTKICYETLSGINCNWIQPILEVFVLIVFFTSILFTHPLNPPLFHYHTIMCNAFSEREGDKNTRGGFAPSRKHFPISTVNAGGD